MKSPESRRAKPFLKWAGGKTKLLEPLTALLPEKIGTYYEPFLGGGALFFHLSALGRMGAAVLGDSNPELINCYEVVRDSTDALIEQLGTLQHDEEVFYDLRGVKTEDLSSVPRAARTIYLNRTCFTPGSQVLLENETWAPIEAVSVGSRLWNGRVVEKVLASPYRGRIRRLKIQGSPFTLSVTEDHPVLAVKGKGSARQEGRTVLDLLGERRLRQAKDLQIGDYVFLPTEGTEARSVDWQSFWPARSEVGPQARPTTLASNVSDQDVARLLGYYAAEGHIAYRYVRGARSTIRAAVWTFNTDERSTHVADVVDICSRLFGVEPKVSPSCVPGKQSLSIELHSVYAARFIHTLVPGQSWAKDPAHRKTKHLHPQLLTASTDVQLELLKGWLRGDGGLRHRNIGNASELSGTCTVLPLARQLYRIAQRCGLKPSWRLSYPNGNETAVIDFRGEDIERLGFQALERRRSTCNQRRLVGGLLAVRVREIVDLEYDGVVHNVDVDGDHLICVDGVISHNCFNGLYRLNKKGLFNTPWGKYTNPRIVDPTNLRACAIALGSRTTLTAGDFTKLVEPAKEGDVVYLDPPYVPLTATANFKSYTQDGFTLDDQRRVAQCFTELVARGVHVVASNADMPIIHELYEGHAIQKVPVPRRINSKGDGRGVVNEVIIVGRRTSHGA